MNKRLMFLCILCTIAIFSFAQEKFSVKGIAGNELNNQLLCLCLMEDGQKVKEVAMGNAEIKKGRFSFSGKSQVPRIALIKDAEGETYPFILEKGKITIDISKNERGGTPLNDTLNVAFHRMKPIIDNLLKTEKELGAFLHSVKKRSSWIK